MKEQIDAALFRDIIICAGAALEQNRQLINDLNVFPVPDGDTGTNMSLTMGAAATELAKRDFDSLGAAADCAAGAMLRGARGNSGVILSLLFRGLAKKLKGRDTADSRLFAEAMTAGVDAALELVGGEEVVLAPVAFLPAGGTAGGGDGELEGEAEGEEVADDGAFAGSAGGGKDDDLAVEVVRGHDVAGVRGC